MKTILLIEDNPDMRENVAEILEMANYTVLTAENGKVGVQLAREHLPDMILCDIMMPVLDGYGVLFMLGKSTDTASIPFIFMTAKTDKSEIRKGMNLGADDYLTKPCDDMELLDTIESRFKRNEIVKSEYSPDLDGLQAFLNEAKGEEALSNLSKDRRTTQYKAQEVIFHEGDYLSSLYFVVSGKVKLWKMNEHGKEFITSIVGKGEFIGYLSLLSGNASIDTASALEPTELSPIPKDEFMDLMQSNRDVAYRFIKLLANNVAKKESHLLSLAYDSVRARVATVLLDLHARYVADGASEISVSRDDLANIVGTATESLIRTVSSFKKEGLIGIQGRRITVLDEKGLQRVKSLY